MALAVRAKRIYDPPEDAEGYRVLIRPHLAPRRLARARPAGRLASRRRVCDAIQARQQRGSSSSGLASRIGRRVPSWLVTDHRLLRGQAC
jgi:hypothetical protein